MPPAPAEGIRNGVGRIAGLRNAGKAVFNHLKPVGCMHTEPPFPVNSGQDPDPISPQRAGMIVLLSIVGVLLLGILLRIVVESVWGPLSWNSPYLIVELLIVLPAVFVVRRRGLLFTEAFRLHPVAWSVAGVSLLLGMSLAVIGDQLDRIVQSWFPMPPEISSQLEALFRNAPQTDFLVMLLIGTVGAGFAEEMLFRGFFQGILEKRTRLWLAIFFPAALFGFIHFVPWLILQITALGMILGLLAWRSQSIYPSVIVHATNNFIAIGFIRWQSPRFEQFYLSGGFVKPAVVLLAIAVFIFSWKIFWRKAPPVQEESRRL